MLWSEAPQLTKRPDLTFDKAPPRFREEFIKRSQLVTFQWQ